MNKKKLQELADQLGDWLDELDSINDSPEIEEVFQKVRDQQSELHYMIDEM
jgi:hypothetical protein